MQPNAARGQSEQNASLATVHGTSGKAEDIGGFEMKHVCHRFRTRTECEQKKNRMREENESHATVNGESPWADRPKRSMDLE